MEKIQFYPLEIRYKIEGGNPVINLYGRTNEGKRVCVIDKKTKPYFLLEPKNITKEEILKIKTEAGNVIGIEEIEKNVIGIKKKLWKIYVNVPKAITAIKEKISGETYEHDILFTHRYLIDKKITPLILCEAEGQRVPQESQVPVFEAEKITSRDSAFTKPKCLAVDIETYNPDGFVINMQEYPIIMIAIYGEGLKKVITWKDIKTDADYVEVVDSESEMLERFAEHVNDYGPDFLVGYNSDRFDLPYIAVRAKKYKLGLDVALDYGEIDISGTSNKKASIAGIVHVDCYPFIRRVMRYVLKTHSYSLDNVSYELLGERKLEVDMEAMAGHWDRNSEELAKYAEYNLRDAELTYRILHKIYPSMMEMTKITNMPLFDVIRMSFSQFVENYLIVQAQDYNEVIPNKPRYGESSARMEQRAQGGFVYEPTPGLYENVAVFDFRSLYPSIIVSHNISLDTINKVGCTEYDTAPIEGNVKFCQEKTGFIPAVLKDLLDRRGRIKAMIKEQGATPLLNARSHAIKIMMASFYGYLGFAMSRWYSFDCVKSITGWGREYINGVIDRAREQGFNIVYGDTDSVFLELGSKTKKDAIHFMEEINRNLPGMMELEFEGLFPAGIFVSAKGTETGAKKRYALMDDQGELLIKGFEIVRRNYSPIGKDVQFNVLKILLSEKDPILAMKYVRDKIIKLKAGKTPIEELVISTQLTKSIEEYASIGPHVAAAKLMQDKGKPVGNGIQVTYVVIGGTGKIRDKVKLPEDTKPEEIDPEYYINNQILPAIEKIFEVFEISSDELVKETKQKGLGDYF